MADAKLTYSIEIRTGTGAPHALNLVAGKKINPMSLGKNGMWRIQAEGILDVHVFLYFDGKELFLQSADPLHPALVNGSPVPKEWTRIHPPATLVLGHAQLLFLDPAQREQPHVKPSLKQSPSRPEVHAQGKILQEGDEKTRVLRQPPEVATSSKPHAAEERGTRAQAVAHSTSDVGGHLPANGRAPSLPPPLPKQKSLPPSQALESKASKPAVPSPLTSDAELSSSTTLGQTVILPPELTNSAGEGTPTLSSKALQKDTTPAEAHAGSAISQEKKAEKTPISLPKKLTLALLPVALVSTWFLLDEKPQPSLPSTNPTKLPANSSGSSSSKEDLSPSAAFPATSTEIPSPVTTKLTPLLNDAQKATEKTTEGTSPLKQDTKPSVPALGEAAPKSLERLAVDAVAAGAYKQAASLYEQLVATSPENQVFREAARLVHAKAEAHF